MKHRVLGRLIWPWKFMTVTPAEKPPLVILNRYPGQVIGVAFRLPDEDAGCGRCRHKALSVLWARPDHRQYPAWEQA